MKVLAQQRTYAAGTTTVIPEEADDVWALYNIITVGDLVKSATTRKVSSKKAGGEHRGKNNVTSVTTILTIRVESVEYVPGEALRVHGRNVCLNAYVPIGKYHTLTVCPLRKVSVFKYRWDAFSIFTLKKAHEAANAETAIVLVDKGVATIHLATETLTRQVHSIRQHIPKKRSVHSGFEKGVTKFHKAVKEAIVSQLDLNQIKVLILAGPGFYKDDLFNYLKTNLDQKTGLTKEVLVRVLVVHSSTAYKSALLELLSSTQSAASNVKALSSLALFDEFNKVLQTDSDRAAYGTAAVYSAMAQAAVDKLLISDQLFRNANPIVRKECEVLIETAKRNGIRFDVFSSAHTSGEQLMALGGLACILRYPMPDLEFEFEVPDDITPAIVTQVEQPLPTEAIPDIDATNWDEDTFM